MGLFTRLSVHARHRDGPGGRHDQRTPQGGKRGFLRGALRASLIAGLLAWPAAAETLRLAVWNAELTRAGPGLLLQSITHGNDPQVLAAEAVLVRLNADTVLLTGVDYDLGQLALMALAGDLRRAGLEYPYALALRPNSGVQTGLDLDGNGKTGEARDAQGFGRFAGSAGMAVLSRYPLGTPRDFSGLLWRDLPGADLPPDMTEAAKAVQLLSTSGHYEVAVAVGQGLRLLVWYGTPPVFDGPEDRNGRRNADETALWLRLLEGALPWPAPQAPFVIIGQSNLDPVDGDGRHDAIRALLGNPAVQDVKPRGTGGRSDPGQSGDPALDTAFYGKGVGGLRVEVILPSVGVQVLAAGVLWPADSDRFAATLAAASRHRPVWVEVALP